MSATFFFFFFITDNKFHDNTCCNTYHNNTSSDINDIASYLHEHQSRHRPRSVTRHHPTYQQPVYIPEMRRRRETGESFSDDGWGPSR
ncbi:uncharacterized protein RCC_03602 [Ramularia collo-cygni]|uniref:Uncharacterized protein n=1 Tax=Ramularia collo-cygni TaxID=112498 RepID=A0A2D3UUJ9_9PEZI|nr:uncharacterized protein RCC_03602 [Ramularia collo-cygni]CZT17765.1 uncharacterized protein RCC_03602 [Ramularia collo-cygni]